MSDESSKRPTFEEFEQQLYRVAEMLGPEEFEKLAIALIESQEEMLRANYPDNRGLKMLDEYRKKQQNESE